MIRQSPGVQEALDEAFATYDRALQEHEPRIATREIGTIVEVGPGVAEVVGLPHVRADELLRFPGGALGLAFDLREEEVGCVLLDEAADLQAGQEVYRTGRVLDVPVGEELLGRVVDSVGRPLDERGSLRTREHRPIERSAPPIMHRDPVTVPLQTGLKVVDALIPIGRGQRELILGDRQTGKTSIAVDTIVNQQGKDVICVYCAIGQRSTSVARTVDTLREHGALDYSLVVVGESNSPAGLQFAAPYAATSIGEYFMERGHDVLVVYDDLTSHARSYRELSLLLRRPPGREAFPGDVFYIHSRLLERSTHLKDEHGGGSLTALPIAETEAQNVSAYIPTNLISITDGQIYVSPDLFRKGLMPAVDVGRSVSRVGGKTQLPAFRTVAGDLRLSYSQFEELEKFARFSSQLDEETRQTLERGRRVRETLKQQELHPLSVPEQIAVLVAVSRGVFDPLPVGRLAEAQRLVAKAVVDELPDLCQRIVEGRKLSQDDVETLRSTTAAAIEHLVESED